MVDLRLNPEIKYSIDFLPSLLDEYGQGMREKASFSVSTSKIDDRDRYLYSNVQ